MADSPNDSLSTENIVLPADTEIDPQIKLKKTASTNQEKFTQIEKSLSQAIASMQQNPSLLSRVSKFWNQFALWKKIIAGIAIAIPTLVLGIVFHLWFLLALGGIVGAIYTGATFLFKDHQKHEVNATKQIETQVFALTDIFKLAITELESLSEQLAEQVCKLSQQNQLLESNVVDLTANNERLVITLDHVEATASSLETTNADLQRDVGTLSDENAKHAELNQQQRQELEKKLIELTQIKDELKESLERAGQLSTALIQITSGASSLVLHNEEERDKLRKALTAFIENRDAAAGIFSAMCTTQQQLDDTRKKLEKTQEQLFENNRCYEELLGQHRELIAQEKAMRQPPAYTSLLKGFGFHRSEDTHALPQADSTASHQPH